MADETTPHPLAGQRVLVTGAAGFIGARAVTLLAGSGVRVTAAMRRRRHSAPVTHGKIEVCTLDLADARATRDIVRNHDVVIDLVHDYTRSAADNIAMHQRLADAATTAGVRRFVHTSSIVVYDDWLRDAVELTENATRSGSGGDYRRAKFAIEEDLAARAKAGTLHAVIVQPTIVYGPRSTLWTDRFAAALAAGTLVLPRGPLGICNGVYVDDVVEALVAAAVRPVAAGSRYIVSGPRPFRWSTLFEGYADAIGQRWLERPPMQHVVGTHAMSPAAQPKGSTLLRRPATRRVLRAIGDVFGEDAVAGLRHRLLVMTGRSGHRYDPVAADPALFLNEATCSIARASRELGYAPGVDVDRGLAATRPYLQSQFVAPQR